VVVLLSSTLPSTTTTGGSSGVMISPSAGLLSATPLAIPFCVTPARGPSNLILAREGEALAAALARPRSPSTGTGRLSGLGTGGMTGDIRGSATDAEPESARVSAGAASAAAGLCSVAERDDAVGA